MLDEEFTLLLLVEVEREGAGLLLTAEPRLVVLVPRFTVAPDVDTAAPLLVAAPRPTEPLLDAAALVLPRDD